MLSSANEMQKMVVNPNVHAAFQSLLTIDKWDDNFPQAPSNMSDS